MTQSEENQPVNELKPVLAPRRLLLRAVAGLGVVGTVGLSTLTDTVRAAIPGVSIEYNRCHAVLVTNASNIDSLAVYYADRDETRRARYGIDPTTTDTQGYDPLVVTYNAEKNRTQIQLTEPQGSLVCITAEADSKRITKINPTDACVPAGFNTTPTASFKISSDPSVDEPVTFTSTATDPDSPERLFYAWDLDDTDDFEASGEAVTTTFQTPGDKRIRHQVTDDCGATNTIVQTITVKSSALFGQSAKLLASNGASGDTFGQSVAVDGDTAVVGADTRNEEGLIEGAAYVFTRDSESDSWSQQQKLSPSELESGAFFGGSVAVDGDTAVIGASGDDEVASGAGAAYVFTRTEGTWSEQQKLLAGDGESGDSFGESVAVDGDTVVIGASGDDENGSNSGAAYVFTQTDDTWSEQQKLLAGDGESGDSFGESVAVDGDTVVVGAPFEDEEGDRAGAAYVFTRTDGTWSQQRKLLGSDIGSTLFTDGDSFGGSVAVDGDTVVAGADRGDENGPGAGAAYVFTRTDDKWSEQQKLLAGDGENGDAFGRSVALDTEAAVIGAPLEEERDDNAGAAYVFE